MPKKRKQDVEESDLTEEDLEDLDEIWDALPEIEAELDELDEDD